MCMVCRAVSLEALFTYTGRRIFFKVWHVDPLGVKEARDEASIRDSTGP